MIPEILGVLDGVEPAQTMEPDQARVRLFDAVTGFLKRASEYSPLLLDLTAECAARYAYCMSTNYIGMLASQQALGEFITAAEKLGNQIWMRVAYWVSSTVARLHGDW